jgi:hypothetical protein
MESITIRRHRVLLSHTSNLQGATAMPVSSTAQRAAAPDTAEAPTALHIALEHGGSQNTHPASTPLRSGAWPRQVRVEITRIENRLRVALVGKSCPHSRAVAEAIRAHLRDAETVIHRRHRFMPHSPFDWWRGTSIEQAYRSLHAARVFLVELVGDEDVDALVPGVLARVQSCLPRGSAKSVDLE